MTDLSPEEQQLWDSVNAIYFGFLAGDRAAIDRSISPEATIWDSAYEPLIRGKAELDAVRDARPADVPAPIDLRAIDPVIDLLGDVALVRHVLVVTYPPEASTAEQRVRNTSVWRLVEGRWVCVHNHEDLIG